jgi:hypothetical protein
MNATIDLLFTSSAFPAIAKYMNGKTSSNPIVKRISDFEKGNANTKPKLGSPFGFKEGINA